MLTEWLHEGWDVHSCLFHVKTSNKEEEMITLTRTPLCLQNWGIYTATCHTTSKSVKTAFIVQKCNDLFGTHAYRTKRRVPKFSVWTRVMLYPNSRLKLSTEPELFYLIAIRWIWQSILCYTLHTFTRGAPKWKFLAEAEQNETLGRRPNTEYGFLNFFPMKAYFAIFFTIA